MKKIGSFVVSREVAGLLVVVPLYLAALLLLQAVHSLGKLLRPMAKLLPGWLPAEDILAVVAVAILCFLIGVVVATPLGRSLWKRMDDSLFQKIPGYGIVRSLTHRVAGQCEGEEWRP